MNVEQLVRDNTTFALKLYRQLMSTDGNLFFSPYSISMTLAMAYAGARARTAEQMATALGFSLSPEMLHPALATLTEQVKTSATAGNLQLKIANALWPQATYHFLDEYLGLIRENYSEQITPLEFSDPETARQTINTWVEQQTETKIKDLIPVGILNPLVRLVLTNAIYFKGSWAFPFNPDSSQQMPFQIGEGQSVNTTFMFQRDDFGYAERANTQILELPYENGRMSMIILLPALGELTKLERCLSSETLPAWLNGLSPKKVAVSLPRFKFSASFSLNEALMALGITDAFDETLADFSGMDGNQNWLFVRAVLHKAFVDVNEEGTEAAAATAVVMQARAMPEPPKIFRADHPFLFLIRENSSGSLLFLGRMMKPATED